MAGRHCSEGGDYRMQYIAKYEKALHYNLKGNDIQRAKSNLCYKTARLYKPAASFLTNLKA